MSNVTEITPDIHYVGVNDRLKHRFEGLWPLPKGVSYNAYLVVDQKIALIDTVDACYTERLLAYIREVIGDRAVDYLVINHMEPDHSASIQAVRQAYPDIQIVGNAKTLQMVEGFYGLTDNTLTVGEGDTMSLGARELQFFLIPMVHWPETMVTYCASDKLVFSGDAFGTFGAIEGGVTDRELDFAAYRDEMIRYYSNIVGKYGAPVQRAIAKLSGLAIDIVCPTHGPVWTKDFPQVLDLYDRMSRYEPTDNGVVIAYGSMYGNTEQTAERIARELSAQGVRNIAMHNLTSSHVSFVLRDIFKYRAVVIGSPTYNMHLFPPVKELLDDIELRCIPNRLFGYFGGFTWAGAAVKRLGEFAERVGWEVVAPPIEVKQGYSPTKTTACTHLATALAERMKE
jgi:flavorubredoxin